MRLDPDRATTCLENALEHETISQVGAGVKWFSDVFGDRHSGHILDPSQPEFSPAVLLRLVRLAYRHVRPEDDVQHESSYSPDIKDYADRGRDALVSALLAKSGVDGFAAKLALAADPMCAHFKDRVLAVARGRAAEDADGIALSEANLVALNRYCEAPPTSRDALFAVMEDRLSDIDDLLLNRYLTASGLGACQRRDGDA
jgi:hypothetical protein